MTDVADMLWSVMGMFVVMFMMVVRRVVNPTRLVTLLTLAGAHTGHALRVPPPREPMGW